MCSLCSSLMPISLKGPDDVYLCASTFLMWTVYVYVSDKKHIIPSPSLRVSCLVNIYPVPETHHYYIPEWVLSFCGYIYIVVIEGAKVRPTKILILLVMGSL